MGHGRAFVGDSERWLAGASIAVVLGPAEASSAAGKLAVGAETLLVCVAAH